MKKKISVAFLLAAMMLALCACSEESSYIGHWSIKSVQAGDVIMEQSDIEDMGLDAGSIRLNKSGSAEIDLLGDEYDGSWELNGDGNATVSYGDGLEGTASLTDDGITFTDAQGSVYVMERF